MNSSRAGLIHFIWLLSLLFATPAAAGFPNRANSELPYAHMPGSGIATIPSITVVGSNSLGPDPIGEFDVVVRDANNMACSGVDVVLDFSGCTDVSLCQTQPAGETYDCVQRTVTATTNSSGIATMTVLGAAKLAPSVPAYPGCGLDAVPVFAADTLLGTVTAAVLDLSYGGGLGLPALDIAFLSDDLGSGVLYGTYRARSDYDFNAVNSPLDLAVFGDHIDLAFLGTGSSSGCTSGGYCP